MSAIEAFFVAMFTGALIPIAFLVPFKGVSHVKVIVSLVSGVAAGAVMLFLLQLSNQLELAFPLNNVYIWRGAAGGFSGWLLLNLVLRGTGVITSSSKKGEEGN